MRSKGWKILLEIKRKIDALKLQQASDLVMNTRKVIHTSSSKTGKRSASERDDEYRVLDGDDLLSEEGSNINDESSGPNKKKVAYNGPTRKSSRIAQESIDPKMKKVAYNDSLRKSSRIPQNMEDVIAMGERTLDPRLEPTFMDDVLHSPGSTSQCFEGSDDEPVDNVPVENSKIILKGTMGSSTRQGRGPAKPWKDWDNGVKKIIEWDEDCQPVGENTHHLMSHLGNLVRNGELFPLTMLSWRKVDKDNLEMIWSSVKENTNAPDGFKDICFTKMGISWKAFKHRVKKDFYKKSETDTKCLANVPPRVEPRQWPTLVAYWSLGDTKKVSEINQVNRGKLCALPRIGRRSFSEIKRKRMLENKHVDLVNMWRATRAKCGSYNEEDGAASTEKMLERRIEELPMEERDNEEQLNKVYKEVVGQDGHGRVLGQEVGIRQCRKCSTSSKSQTEVEKTTNAEIEQLQKDAEKLREETEALRRERDEQEARHAKELETVKNDLKTERGEQKARHKKELEKVKSELSTEIKAQVATMFANALLLPQTSNTTASTIFGSFK